MAGNCRICNECFKVAAVERLPWLQVVDTSLNEVGNLQVPPGTALWRCCSHLPSYEGCQQQGLLGNDVPGLIPEVSVLSLRREAEEYGESSISAFVSHNLPLNVGIYSINGLETSWQSVILMTHPHRHICLTVSLWKLLLFTFSGFIAQKIKIKAKCQNMFYLPDSGKMFQHEPVRRRWCRCFWIFWWLWVSCPLKASSLIDF